MGGEGGRGRLVRSLSTNYNESRLVDTCLPVWVSRLGLCRYVCMEEGRKVGSP